MSIRLQGEVECNEYFSAGGVNVYLSVGRGNRVTSICLQGEVERIVY